MAVYGNRCRYRTVKGTGRAMQVVEVFLLETDQEAIEFHVGRDWSHDESRRLEKWDESQEKYVPLVIQGAKCSALPVRPKRRKMDQVGVPAGPVVAASSRQD